MRDGEQHTESWREPPTCARRGHVEPDYATRPHRTTAMSGTPDDIKRSSGKLVKIGRVGVLLGLFLLSIPFVLPIAGWVSARRTRRRVAALESVVYGRQRDRTSGLRPGVERAAADRRPQRARRLQRPSRGPALAEPPIAALRRSHPSEPPTACPDGPTPSSNHLFSLRFRRRPPKRSPKKPRRWNGPRRPNRNQFRR
jgi:hypothetical protein